MTTPNPETHKHLVDALCSGYCFDTDGAEALLKEYVAPLRDLAEIGRLAVEERIVNHKALFAERSRIMAAINAAADAYIAKHPTG